MNIAEEAWACTRNFMVSRAIKRKEEKNSTRCNRVVL
jgi:hypothetical protein